MLTEKLYKNDVYLTETDAEVISVNKKENIFVTEFSRTVFFPEGGGQSGDRGKIVFNGKVYNVLDTKEERERVLHFLDNELRVGDRVHMVLDWEHRFDNMQRHSGEHIVSGAFYELFGGINRGFHMGEDHMTVDISLEDEKKVDSLTWEMCLEAEKFANDLIYANLPVLKKHFDTKEEAGKYPMRKKLAIEKDITLVGIGSWDNAYGTVACCGTHPSTTGQVGLIKFYKMEINKGMYRIYLEAGKRAYLKYMKQYETFSDLGRRFSASPDDILEKYDISEQKQKEKNDQLYRLKKEIISREAREINSIGEEGLVREYSILSLNDLVDLAKEISDLSLCFLFHKPTNTVIVLSNGKNDCGKLVKDNAGVFGGKGGGNKTMARAIFTKEENAKLFIDSIEKVCR